VFSSFFRLSLEYTGFPFFVVVLAVARVEMLRAAAAEADLEALGEVFWDARVERFVSASRSR